METFVVTLRLRIESRQSLKGISERGWVVVVHGSIIAVSRGAIIEAVQRLAQNFAPPHARHSM
jgi:hypothetical protein